MKLSTLASNVGNLNKARVLCVGDIMLDRFVYGSVNRTSPEAPVPIIRIENEKKMLGGAGNVARNIISLGAKTILISVVGDDLVGRELTKMVGAETFIEPCLLVEAGRSSTQKTRFVSGNHQLLRADIETVTPVSKQISENLIGMVQDLLSESDIVVISDYEKGVISPNICKKIISCARKDGKTIIVDPKGADFSLYKNCDIITPNRNELALATGNQVESSEEIVVAASKLMKELNISKTLVTRSAEGISLIGHNGEKIHFPAQAREVYDVSGAGDTVVATLAASLGSGLTLNDSAALANTAAGVVVSKPGTAVVEAPELFHALRANDLTDAEAKIVPTSSAILTVQNWRKSGYKIGFTNGCFDLLHPGHISLLNQAKSSCDKLVVGLNSDHSVQQLKGINRPIQSEDARAQVLSSLETVDLVVIFTEETPVLLIEEILPDLLIKGSDYKEDEVVGGEFVIKNGGKILLADIVSGFSTTNTINKLLD